MKHSDREIEERLAEYIRQRNAFLSKAYDAKKTLKWIRENSGKHYVPMSAETLEASFHKARTSVPAIELALRKESKKWLTDHGFQSHDDGEL